MLIIKHFYKSYFIEGTRLQVLKRINLSVKEGNTANIMAAFGSGKSTLLNIIGMLDVADFRGYILDTISIIKKAAIYRNKFIEFIFQSFNLINYKNALGNVTLPLYYQGTKRKVRQELVLFYLEKVGLIDSSQHLPKEPSVTHNQRIATPSTLAANPKILLEEESTDVLDTLEHHMRIAEFIQQLNDEGKNILIFFYEEDIATMCKRIMKLLDGIIIEDIIIDQIKSTQYV